MGVIFSFLQPLGTWPDCHDFSNVMESGFKNTAASSLGTLKFILLGPVDLCILRWFSWSQICSSLMVGGTLFSQSLPWGSGSWEMWEEWLPVKNEAKKFVEYLNFLQVPCPVFSFLFISGVHFLLSSFSDPHTCRNASFYSSHALPNSAPTVP